MGSNGRLRQFLGVNGVRGRDRIFTISEAVIHRLNASRVGYRTHKGGGGRMKQYRFLRQFKVEVIALPQRTSKIRV